MGLMQDIFGGSESKSQSQTYRPSQGNALDELLKMYTQGIGQGQKSYGGTRVAPLTSDQQAATGALSGFVNQLQPMPNLPAYDQVGSSLQGLLAGETGAEAYTPQAVDSYYRNAIEQPAMQQWGKSIKPGIEEQYAGPGYWGSARAGAVTEGAQDLQNWLGSERAQLAWDAEQSNKQIQESKANRALSALGPGMDYLSAPQEAAQASLAGLSQVAALSGLNQQQQQAEINASIQAFAEENRLTDPEDMQILLALLGMNYSASSSKSESTGGIVPGISGLIKALPKPS